MARKNNHGRRAFSAAQESMFLNSTLAPLLPLSRVCVDCGYIVEPYAGKCPQRALPLPPNWSRAIC